MDQECGPRSRADTCTGFVKGGASTFTRCQRQCIEARAQCRSVRVKRGKIPCFPQVARSNL